MTSKPSDEWYTPPALVRALGDFDLDPACGPLCPNITARRRVGPKEDGLSIAWRGRVWLNPPFSNSTPWVERMIEHGNGILLSFCRSDAGWFQRAICAGQGVFLLMGRTEFDRPNGKTSRCPLGCCLIPFGRENRDAILKSGIRGTWLYRRAKAA